MEKTNASVLPELLSSIDDKTKLEALGKNLSSNQIAEILAYVNAHQDLIDKLPPIFVGMSQETFCQLLTELNPEELMPLKQEALTEAIQHHLTLLVQDLTKQIAQIQTDLMKKEASFEAIDVAQTSDAEIQNIYREIEACQQQSLQSQKLLNSALAIAWNTMRSDLIENLSRINEQQQRLLHTYEGDLGLKALFEAKLNQIFIEFDDDNVPATEALAKLGVWYLKDYWEIGLLPDIKSEDALQPSANASPVDAQTYREKLFLEVNANLEKIGLATLADLKSNQIYSKTKLEAYIKSTLKHL